LDARRFPRDKVCAGWITPEVVAALELDGSDYGRDHVLQAIHGFRIGLIGGRTVCTRRSAAALSYGILRRQFDDHLLRRSGARLRLGEPLSELRRTGDGWVANGEIRAPLVVGAGGHHCPVSRRLGTRSVMRRVVVAREVEFEIPAGLRERCGVDPEVPELLFCRDLKGYGWIFRKGDYLNAGLGREGARGFNRQLEEFVPEVVRRSGIPLDRTRKWRGHAYGLYPGGPRRVSAAGVLLIGDAAALADGRSGEGIGPAVESALLAAATIARADGDYRAEQLARYDESLARRFGARARAAGEPGRLLAGLRAGVARKLLAAEWFARRVVIDRWFLHRQRGGRSARELTSAPLVGSSGAARLPGGPDRGSAGSSGTRPSAGSRGSS
jgi:flavin-dependent dehydrogenase